MKLMFENKYGKRREIATIDDGQKNDEIFRNAVAHIQRFCDEHNFVPAYMRMWHDESDGNASTVFDVGSHSEFFVLDGIVRWPSGGGKENENHT